MLAVLQTLLAPRASVLEIASGTGEHAEHFATAQPGWRWQPTERDPRLLRAIAQRCAALPNVPTPLALDVLRPWPAVPQPVDAVLCANMLHIAPWACTQALLTGAAGTITPGGLLLLYGPFIVDGEPVAPSNLAFDADLRSRDPAWGVRLLAEVHALAEAAGFGLERRFDMPANNLLLAWRRGAPAALNALRIRSGWPPASPAGRRAAHPPS